MSRALIVIDMQQEWNTDTSAYFIDCFEDLIADVNDLIDAVREDGDKVLFTAHVEPEGEEFVQGTPGSQLAPGLHRTPNDAVLAKNTISPFFDGKLDELLEGVEELLVCGVATNLCVRQTVEEAYDRGLDVIIVSDCCAAPSDYAHSFTLTDLEQTRPDLTFVELEEFLNPEDDETPAAPTYAAPSGQSAPPSPAPSAPPSNSPPQSPAPPPLAAPPYRASGQNPPS